MKMTEITGIRSAGLLLQAGMLLCFSLMAIFWIRIAQLGGFSLEAYHVGLMCLVALTCISLYSPASIYRVIVYCTPWFLAFLVYLLLLIPAVRGTQATGLIMKQLLFTTGFVCVAAYFVRAPDPARNLRIGGLCGILLYLAFTEYSAHRIGKSLIGATLDFMTSGSFKALIYGFFRPVFNSFENSTEPTFVASLTNSIAVSLLVLSILYRAGHSKQGLDLLGTCVTGLTLFLGLLLNSRSVVMVAVASVIVAFLIRHLVVRAISLMELLYWCLAAAVIVGLVFAVSLRSTSAVDAILTAFEFSDDSTGSRLDQYSWAVGLINQEIIWGHGYIETESGLPIHNLFLSSWAYVGLLGFLLVLVFYATLLFVWLRWLYYVVTVPGFWVLNVRVEWVAVLPILLLFRVWISGAGGLPAYGEWIALGVFIGLMMRNELERKSLSDEPDDRRESFNEAELGHPTFRRF